MFRHNKHGRENERESIEMGESTRRRNRGKFLFILLHLLILSYFMGRYEGVCGVGYNTRTG